MKQGLSLHRRLLFYSLLTSECALLLACGRLWAQPRAAISSADEKQFVAAMAAIDHSDTRLAEALLTPLHNKYPSLYAVNESLGLLYAGEQRLEEALPLLKAAKEEDPSSDLAHANLGSAYFKLGKNADALRELQQAARINSTNAATQQTLGEVWMQQRQPAQAARAFASALRVSPGNSDLAYDEAVALHGSGQSKAAADVLAGMHGVEDNAAAQSLYGDVEEKIGNYKEAVEHYILASRVDPSESNVFALGAEFLRHWTFEPAIQEFAFAVRQFPSSQRMQLGLGVAYFGNRNYDKATPVFADLLKSYPENALYAELVGRACTVETAGDDPRCDSLIQFAKHHPEDALISTLAATHIIEDSAGAGQAELARSLLVSALKADPKMSLAQYQLGVLMQTEERWPESIPYLEAAIHLQPEYSEAHYRLGLAYVRAGRKSDARGEMLLFRQFSAQTEEERNAKLRQITTFVVSTR